MDQTARKIVRTHQTPSEDDEDAQSFVTREAVISTRGHEGSLSLSDRGRLTLYGEHSTTFEHDVELIVLMRLLPVRLGRNEAGVISEAADRRCGETLRSASRVVPRNPTRGGSRCQARCCGRCWRRNGS